MRMCNYWVGLPMLMFNSMIFCVQFICTYQMDEAWSYTSSLYSYWDELYPHSSSCEEFLKKIEEQEQEEVKRDNQCDFAEGFPSPVCVFIYLLRKRIDKFFENKKNDEERLSSFHLLSLLLDFCEEQRSFLSDLPLSQYHCIIHEFLPSISVKQYLLIVWALSKFLLKHNKQGKEIWKQFKSVLAKNI